MSAIAETRACQACKKEFTVAPEDFDFYEKMNVPAPTWCPTCRFMRRISFWNQRNVFKKAEEGTGKMLFSMFRPDSKIKILENPTWWSDAFDPMKYGRPYDFARPFFEQFKELMYDVPRPARSVTRLTDSDYVNNAADLKSCYMCFNADISENCMYGVGFDHLASSIDVYKASKAELCYELSNSSDCYGCFFTSNSGNCRDSWFLENCNNCTDCIGCVNLRGAQYHIFNKPYSKEDYAKKLEALSFGSAKAIQDFKKEFEAFKLQLPVKFAHEIQNTNTIGEYAFNSKNAKYCYQVIDSENVAYSQSIGMGLKDSYDYTNWGNNAESMYETMDCGENVSNIKFSNLCWGSVRNMEYCVECHGSSDCFGCVGLKTKQYCIFNVQYSKEEYESLRAKIVAHMNEVPYTDAQRRVYRYGEFFPSEFSPFGVNDSAVLDYFPMTKEEAIQQGFAWRDDDPPAFQITIKGDDLPDHINDVSDDILQAVVGCAACGRAFRIVPTELTFYKRFSLPLPHLCFTCRHEARARKKNIPEWTRQQCECSGTTTGAPHPHGPAECPNVFETTYPVGHRETVYCGECYQVETA
jgi:hypothetical protein